MTDLLPPRRPSPRYPPTRLTSEQVTLFRKAYPEKEKSLHIITMIERHIDYLQETGDCARARNFLASECNEAAEEVQRLAVYKRRAAIRVVAKTTVSLAILVAARVILSYFNII